MPVVPVVENLSWKNPPYITVLLIILNIFVYFSFQHNDFYYQNTSMEYFLVSGMADLEIPLYINYLKDSGEKVEETYDDILKLKPEERNNVLISIHFASEEDSRFQKDLEAGNIIDKESPTFLKLMEFRKIYEERQEKIVGYKYGFIPAKFSIIDLFSYMFLHGSFSHLFWNMVFLWLVGVMVEQAVSRTTYIFIYLSTGAFAALFFFLIHMDSHTPLIGASGAISGLMGAYSVLYLKKKVKVLIYLGFYFNTVRVRALWLLPLWVLKEAYSFFVYSGSGVAYTAHMGGLIAGGIEGYMALSFFTIDPGEYMPDAKKEDSAVSKLMRKAKDAMIDLEFDQARAFLKQAMAEDPSLAAPFDELYELEKLFPRGKGYQNISREFILFLLNQNKDAGRLNTVFNEYVSLSSPKFSSAEFLELALFFMNSGFLGTSERILNTLIKKSSNLDGLPGAVFRFASIYGSRGRDDKKEKYCKIIAEFFPDSPEAAKVQSLNLS